VQAVIEFLIETSVCVNVPVCVLLAIISKTSYKFPKSWLIGDIGCSGLDVESYRG
jgi:hypothetical protein